MLNFIYHERMIFHMTFEILAGNLPHNTIITEKKGKFKLFYPKFIDGIIYAQDLNFEHNLIDLKIVYRESKADVVKKSKNLLKNK